MTRPRLRDLGIVIGRHPTGPLNAITDIEGVRIGHATLVRESPTVVRTGVTAIWPRDGIWDDYCFAGFHSFNGFGEMTGTIWLAEQGLLGAPIGLTNTYAIGAAHEAICRYAVDRGIPQAFHLPVVAETWDGWLSDAETFPVTVDLAREAIDAAKPGPVAEGNVGGGTGMITHEFKGGIGTASREVETPAGRYRVGALVQSNYGRRYSLTVAGVPVGEAIGPDRVPSDGFGASTDPKSSIIVVLATDAPLIPIQCQRLARRATVGLARVGGIGNNGSGDIFLAFSTANHVRQPDKASEVRTLQLEAMTELFEGAAEATEEAILNALVAAETMTGYKGRVVHALPHDLLLETMARYGRGPGTGRAGR